LVRPDLVAAQAQVDSFRASARAASRAGLPSIEIAANAQHSQWSAHGIQRGYCGYDSFGALPPPTQTYLLGINLRIPIFSGFKDTYNQRQAEVQTLQAESARDALYRQTQLEVWQAYYDLQTVIGSISSTKPW